MNTIFRSVSQSRWVDYQVAKRSYLELVLAGLSLRRRVEEIDRENLYENRILVRQNFQGKYGIDGAIGNW